MRNTSSDRDVFGLEGSATRASRYLELHLKICRDPRCGYGYADAAADAWRYAKPPTKLWWFLKEAFNQGSRPSPGDGWMEQPAHRFVLNPKA
jgi:hypothetical protein